jgi:hypothetical protein
MRSILLISLFGFISMATLFGVGCERQRSMRRVSDALQPPFVEVTNGQSAVLKLRAGYAVVIPTYIQSDRIPYKVLLSTNGDFSTNLLLLKEGVGPTRSVIEVGGASVSIQYDGLGVSTVGLGFADTNTGIALFFTNDLHLLEVSELRFLYGRTVDREDFLKAAGK